MNRQDRNTCLLALDNIRLIATYLETAGLERARVLDDDPDLVIPEALHPSNVLAASGVLRKAHAILMTTIRNPEAQRDELFERIGVPEISSPPASQ